MAARWNSNYSIYRRYLHEVGNLYRNRQDVRAYTELLLSLFTIAIFGAFAIRPTLTTIAELNTEIQSKQDTLDKLNKKINDLGKAKTVYSEEASRIILLATAIPDEPTPHTYVRQLEGLINNNQVQLVDMEMDKVKLTSQVSSTAVDEEKTVDANPLDVSTFAMSLTLTGDYVQLASFIDQLEKLRRPFIFETTGFTVSEVDADQARILLTITGTVPFQPKNL